MKAIHIRTLQADDVEALLAFELENRDWFERHIDSRGSAFYSVQSEIELRRKAALNIVSWMRTGRPDYPVVNGTRTPPAR